MIWEVCRYNDYWKFFMRKESENITVLTEKICFETGVEHCWIVTKHIFLTAIFCAVS